MPKKCRYATCFDLAGSVQDINEAREYLAEDDMKQYYDGPGKEKIEQLVWELQARSYGYILVDTNEELTEEESRAISSYIRGQNSDGLGEGFEQNFIDEYGEMCSFDWYDNHYPLHRYRAKESGQYPDSQYNEGFWNDVDRCYGKWEE